MIGRSACFAKRPDECGQLFRSRGDTADHFHDLGLLQLVLLCLKLDESGFEAFNSMGDLIDLLRQFLDLWIHGYLLGKRPKA